MRRIQWGNCAMGNIQMSRLIDSIRTGARLLLPLVAAVLMQAGPAIANTYTVSNTNDSGNGSLRKAITDANAHAGTDTIWLIIGSGNQTITPTSALPDITDAVLIDGWVQGGFSSAPLIRIDGNLLPASSTGLRIYAGPTTLRGVIFTRFTTGVLVGGGDSIAFRGCYFGTTGAAALGNQTGLRLYSGTNITLGGSGATDGNVISGNSSYGVYIDPTIAGLTLQGNRIGTNAAGTAALGNGSAGVVSFASNVIVGGATAAERNLFSGNGADGLAIEAGSVGITIRGNYFGLDATGTLDLGNGGSGLSEFGTSVVIGGSAAGQGNVSSGNSYDGMAVGGGTVQMLGNRIGTNAAGTASIGNIGYGARISGSDVTIGGSAAGAGNLFSGNGNNGLYIDSTASGVVVKGNTAGLNATGTADLGNGGTGIGDLGSGTVIGGTLAGEGNISSGNSYYGLGLGGQNTTVLGNRLGTNPAGTAAIANDVGGIYITGVNITVGGTTAAARNLVSGNGSGIGVQDMADGIYLYGNYIGTDVTGALKLANSGSGVATYGANVSIGGTVAGSGNIISGNGGEGIYIGGGSGLAIRRNYIGTDATGMFALGNGGYAIRADGAPGTQIGTPGNGNVMSANERGVVLGYDASGYFIRGNIIGLSKDATQRLGNNEYGISIGTADNLVGGTTLGAFNVIGASTYYGILISGTGATNNRIENNYIGTNVALASGLGNWFGIVIYGGHDNFIGNVAAGTGNVITDSINDGIYNWYGSHNHFLQNSVYGNGGVGIENLPRGPRVNDLLDPDYGPNNGQNFPTVTDATTAAGNVTVAGFLESEASKQYRVEYFVSPDCEASGFGEGQHYIGFQNVSSNASGKAVLGTSLPTAYVSGFVTATATDPDGNTSEFSPCIAIGSSGAGEFNLAGPFLAYEDFSPLEITVTRSLGFTGAVSVRVTTSDDTATAPADYAAVDQVLNFGDGESVKKIIVPIAQDNAVEGTQKFNVALSQATGGAFIGGQSSASVTLFDHDPLYPVYSVVDVGVSPPAAGQKIVNVPIQLSSATDHTVTLTYVFEDASAHAGTDYIAASGQVVFAIGEKVKLAPVTLTVNGPLPADRVFYLRINGGSGQVIAGDSEGEIIIFGGDRIFANGFSAEN